MLTCVATTHIIMCEKTISTIDFQTQEIVQRCQNEIIAGRAGTSVQIISVEHDIA